MWVVRQNRKETSQDRQLQRIKNHFQRAFFDIKQTMNSCSTSLSSLYTFPTSNLIIFSMSKLRIWTCLISSSSWTLSNSISLVSTCLFSNGNKYSFYTSLYLILAISSPSRPRACSSMPQIKKSFQCITKCRVVNKKTRKWWDLPGAQQYLFLRWHLLLKFFQTQGFIQWSHFHTQGFSQW